MICKPKKNYIPEEVDFFTENGFFLNSLQMIIIWCKRGKKEKSLGSYIEDIEESDAHELVPEVHPEVEVVGLRDDGVDQDERLGPQLLVWLHEQPLDDRAESGF